MTDKKLHKVLAIIPARGGSKGIPQKNIQLLCGKPLLTWSIAAAKASEWVERVIVSTDASSIAEVARGAGAEVIMRPSEISGDLARSESALLHTLECLRSRENYQPDYLVFLQATSPLTVAEDIDGTVQTLLDEGADSALAVAPFHYFLWEKSSDNQAIGINHDKSFRPLRQEREGQQYRETGAIYVMETRQFLQAGHRFFGKTSLYVMPEERCHEIDEPVDFAIAEGLMRQQLKRSYQELLPKKIEAVVYDFDGVFTDNRVHLNEAGLESGTCHRGDGMGCQQLQRHGIRQLILSSEVNPVVAARGQKLGLTVIQGVRSKLERLQQWLGENAIALEHTLFLGNDINDRECLKAVGCGVIVADAHPSVFSCAKIVLENKGGFGAIRELTDLIGEHLRNSGIE